MIVSEYIGLTDIVFIPIENQKAIYDYTKNYTYTPDQAKSVIIDPLSEPKLKSASLVTFNFMGSFDSNGVPTYLTDRDLIEKNFIDDINATLPERKRIPLTQPEFIAGGTETNLILTKTADVWITFVAEGAGWRNAVGYYTFPANNPPSSAAQIAAHNIIFPNVSMSGSGGGLVPGDKVNLGRFPANTGIGWFIVANGFTGKDLQVGPHGIHYSDPSFNQESNSSQRGHMVFLQDKVRQLFLIGFEDMRRDNYADEDFNDALFYVTANPVSAVATQNVKSIVAANDKDNDGVNDELDQFPNDPDKAFNNFSPSASTTGTIAFEDLWPSKGDYDFNDLVVGYNYSLATNAQNKVTSIKATFNIQHIGGSFKNGFGIKLPVAASEIKSIRNQVLNAGYTSVSTNGTEAGMSEAVIMVIENAIHYEGKEIVLEIEMNTPVESSTFNNPPYDPFLIVNGNRSKEVHLPDMVPTGNGMAYLGRGDDNSNPAKGFYFKSKKGNLPWAIYIPDSYNMPSEKVAINKVYPRFVNWANSGGMEDTNWYK